MIQSPNPNTSQHPVQTFTPSQESTQKYNTISQIAYYSSLQQIQQLQIFTKSSYDVQCNIIFCYHAEKFRTDRKKQIMYYMIRMLNQEIPKLKNRYSFMYVHGDIGGFLYFRDVVRLLPVEFLKKMKEIWVVDGGVGVKVVEFFSCGEMNRYIKARTRHIHRIQDIEAMKKIKLVNTPQTTPKNLNESQRNTLTITKQHQSSDVKIIHNKLYGKQLNQYQLSSKGLPLVIQTLLEHLYSDQSYLRAEGIMRKSCDVEELEILENVIMDQKNWKDYVRKYDNPYVICGCVKKIFNNLNTPLFSYQIYDAIIAYRTDGQLANDLTFIRNLISKMPKLHREVLTYMIAFLKRGIILHQQHNKMSPYNLAVVFGPCFFRPKVYRLEDLMSSGKCSFVVKVLLENFQDVVGEENVIRMYEILEKSKMMEE